MAAVTLPNSFAAGRQVGVVPSAALAKQLTAAADVFGDAVCVLDDVWRPVAASRMWRDGVKSSFVELLTGSDAAGLVGDALLDGRTATVDITVPGFSSALTLEVVPLSGGCVARLHVTGPLAERARLLESSISHLTALACQVPHGLGYCSQGLRMNWANEQVAEVLGLAEEDVLGVGWTRVFADFDELSDACGEVLEGSLPRTELTTTISRHGHLAHVCVRIASLAGASGGGFVVSFEDVTEQVRRTQKLEREAHTDALTGLANRLMMNRRLAVMLNECRQDRMCAVMFLDLDGFKAINDTYGHDAGDELLCAIAGRLSCAVRPGDFAARLAGDEFVVVLSELDSVSQATAVADRVLELMSVPVDLGGVLIDTRVSVGVALASARADVSAVLKAADGAMYQAKHSGKGCWRLADDVVSPAAG